MRSHFARWCRTFPLVPLLGCWACQAPIQDDSAEIESRSIEIVRAFIAEPNWDYETFRAYVKEGAVWHFRGETMDWTWEEEIEIEAMWKRAFPDQEYHIDLILAKGDTVVTFQTYTGTHRDTIMGIPPTGRTVAVPEAAIYRLEGDLIAEQWVVFDEHLLRQQLTR